MPLKYKRSLLANTGPSLQTVIIDNSDVISVGDCVQIRNGNLEVIGVGAAMAGVVVDIVDKSGNSVSPKLGTLASLGTATRSAAGAVTVAADNETVDQIACKIDVSPFSVWSASVTGTLGATVASKPGASYSIVSGTPGTVDETTGSRTITATKTLISVPSLNPANGALDDDDTTRLLVKIGTSELFDNWAALS